MFCIFASRWRVFQTTMHLSPGRATPATLSALTLHNYLLKSLSKGIYCAPCLIDQEDEQGNVVAGSWCTEYSIGEFKGFPPQCHRNNISKS